MSLVEDLHQLQAQAQAELAQADTAEASEAWRVKYLGSKGALKAALAKIKDIPARQKGQYGQAANKLKQTLTAAFKQHQAQLGDAKKTAKPMQDVTLPGIEPRVGHTHIITQTIWEICDIFGRMGFGVAYGPEVEDEQHNFVDLNIPASHPARDPLENFYIDHKAMLRSQTSTVQIRIMENSDPPIRVVAPGRVYRPDTVDATHSFMFHQLEGLYVDEGVTMVDLRTSDVQTRFRPSFFPFTEPSAEVDVLFHYPDGSSRWIELGGCGMVDPNVLTAVNIDPEKYTGWAFGLGIERMVMRKHNVPDIRMLFESDVRFLRQF